MKTNTSLKIALLILFISLQIFNATAQSNHVKIEPVNFSNVTVTDAFLQQIFAEGAEATLTIDLEKQTIIIDKTGAAETFDINAYKKTCMLNGYDDIDYLLSIKKEIEQFELNHKMN